MFDFFRRKPKEEPVPDTIPVEIREWDIQGGRTPEQKYRRAKHLLLTSREFVDSDETVKRKMLEDFFETEAKSYLLTAANIAPESLPKIKQIFVSDVMDMEKKKAIVPEVEVPKLPEDWPDLASDVPRVTRDVTQRYEITSRNIEVDYPLLLQHKAERAKVVSENVKKELGEIKNPVSFLARGETALREVNRNLRGAGLNSFERNEAIAHIKNTVHDSFIENLRKNVDPEQLRVDAENYAQEFLKEKETGTFLDAQTGERRNEPKTDEETDYLALLEQVARSTAFDVGLYDENSEMGNMIKELDEESSELERHKDELLARKKSLEEFYASKRDVITEEDLGKYNKMYDEYKMMYDEYSIKVNTFNKKLDEFNLRLGENTEKALAQENPTTKERLKNLAEDSFLEMRYWATYIDSIRQQITGEQEVLSQENLHKALKRGQENFNTAQAKFEATARMAYFNQGPQDIKREGEFLARHFAHNTLAGIDIDLARQVGASPMEMIQKMGMVAEGVGVELTDEETQALKMSLGETIAGGLGYLGPVMVPLMLYGRVAQGLKLATKGHKIIRMGRAARMPKEITLARGMKAPEGYELTGATLGGRRVLDIEKNIAKLMRDPAFKGASQKHIKTEAHVQLLKDIDKASKIHGKRLALNYRSIADVGLEGKTVKHILPLDAKLPHGAELIKEVKYNRVQSAMAHIANILMDEIAYTQLFGFEPGAATGIAISNKLPSMIRFENRLQALNPILGFQAAGVGATVGIYGGMTTAGLGEALFTDKSIADIMQELFPEGTDLGKQLLSEIIIHTLFFGPTGALTQSAAKQQTAPYRIGTTRRGNPDYMAYFSPVKRDAVFRTAREMEKKGMPDVAKELYKWLDLTREPLTGSRIKMEREEALLNIYNTASTGFLMDEAAKHRRVIDYLEREMTKSNPQNYLEIPLQNYAELKPRDVVSKTVRTDKGYKKEYYEIVEVKYHYFIEGKDDARRKIKGLLVKNIETNKITEVGLDVKGNLPFDPVKNYKLSNAMEIPGRIELHRSTLEVLDYVIAQRNVKEAKMIGRGEVVALPVDAGEIFVPKEDIVKGEKRVDELKKERGVEVKEPELLIEQGKILGTTAKEFSEKLNIRQKTYVDKIRELENESTRITGEIDKYKGFLSLEQKKEKQDLQQKLNTINKDIEIAEAEFANEVQKIGVSISADIEGRIKELSPDVTDETISDVKNLLWEMMANPEKQEEQMTVDNLIVKAIEIITGDETVPVEQKVKPVEAEKIPEEEKPITAKEKDVQQELVEKPQNPSLFKAKDAIMDTTTGKTYKVVNPNKKGKSVLMETDTGKIVEVQAHNNQKFISIKEKDVKPLVEEGVVNNPEEVAKNLIREEVLRGDTIEDIKERQTGYAGDDYAVQIGGYAMGNKYSADHVIVSKWDGTYLDKPVIFKLKDIYDAVLEEKAVPDIKGDVTPEYVPKEEWRENLIKAREYITNLLSAEELLELRRKGLLKWGSRESIVRNIEDILGKEADIEAVSPRDVEELKKPQEVRKQITSKDIEEELNILSGLMDDIDFGISRETLAMGDKGDLDARSKALNITKGIIQKMIDSDVYNLPDMVKLMIGLPTKKIEQLIPFLRQSYDEIYKLLPQDVKAKMNIKEANEFDVGTLYKLIEQITSTVEKPKFDIVGKTYHIETLGSLYKIKHIAQYDDHLLISMMGGIWKELPSAGKPLVAVIEHQGVERGVLLSDIEQAIEEGWAKEVPKYDNPEYRKSLDEVIAIYNEIGRKSEAVRLENMKHIDPEFGFGLAEGWESIVKKQKDIALRRKYEQDVLAGKIMPKEIEGINIVSMEELRTIISEDALVSFIQLGKETMAEFLSVANEKIKILAKLGFTVNDIKNLPAAYQSVFMPYNTEDLRLLGERMRLQNRGDSRVTDSSINNARKLAERTINKMKESLDDARRIAATLEIKYMLNHGHKFGRFSEVEKIAEKYGLKGKVNIKEQIELALTEISDGIVRSDVLTQEEKFHRLIGLTNQIPPLISARTAESKELQQYSTPPPIAYLMTLYTNTPEVDKVLDPQAGQGILLIGAIKGKAWGNEIDKTRASNLKLQGIFTTTENSLKGLDKYDTRVPAINMNPPFLSGLKENIDGYSLSGEYTIIANNLNRHLENTGKAAIIAGGNVRWKPDGQQMADKDLMFFNWLYHHYNVVDVINVSGGLYESMGANYPTKLILVDGRKVVPAGNAPLYNEMFKPIEGFKELYDRVNNQITKPNEKSILQTRVDANRTLSPTMGGTVTVQLPGENRPSTDATIPREADRVTPADKQRGERLPIGTTEYTPGVDTRRGIRANNTPRLSTGTSNRPAQEGRRDRIGGGFGTVQPRRSQKDLPVHNIGKPNQHTIGDRVLAEDAITPYVPLSKAKSGNFVVPVSIVAEIDDALRQFHEAVGDVDSYVADKLNYPGVDAMQEHYFAEQIDAIGMAVYQIETGSSMIIGHQTGTGKGRIAAGIVRYAIENGKLPVFVTRSADLFTDIYRDMKDTGSAHYKPFIINTAFSGSGENLKIFDQETGKVLYEVDAEQNRKILGSRGVKGTHKLPDGTQLVLTTYSQFSTENRDDHRRDFLKSLVQNNEVVFVMDESHMASGQSSTGDFFMNWIKNTGGGLFLSATYAKRASNMPVYAMKTVLQETNMDFDSLVETIQRGGNALQEIISRQLAETGQFSKVGFKLDADINYMMLGDNDKTQRTYNPDLGTAMRNTYDKTIGIVNEIISFQKKHINPLIDELNEEAKKRGKQVTERKGISEAGVKNYPYFSRVWNIVDQMLLSIKVKEILPYIIEELQGGRKPVIALRSTMESLFSDMEEMGLLSRNKTISMDFSEVLARGLRTVMKYTVVDAMGVRSYEEFAPENLPAGTKAKYYELQEKIRKTETGLNISPIDVLRKGITDAGFKVEEITGRGSMFVLNDDMTEGVYKTNDRSNKIQAIANFNNNPGYAVIINAAGSTGISLHSGRNFNDHSQRIMFIPQFHLDINETIQTLGRVYRADQVNKPTYNFIISGIPAEQRIFMMLARKLKSLDANTSGNQKHSKNIIDVPDFLNKYGDEVVREYLEENHEINEMLGDPLNIGGSDVKKTDAAHKVSGRVQILSTKLQEEFYNEITERYESEIEYLNTTGLNDLAVTHEDLQAEIMKSDVVVTGNGGMSAFGDDTILNVAEVNVRKKPLTHKELESVLSETLKDKTASEYVANIKEKMADGMNVLYEKKIAEANEYAEKLRTVALEKIKAKGDGQKEMEVAYAEAKENIEKYMEMKIRTLNDQKSANIEKLNRYFNFFYPGRVLNIPFDEGNIMELVRMNRGVFLGYDINMAKPNAWAPSNIYLRFATTDSRRVFRIPASKKMHIDSIIGNSYNITPHYQRETLANWDTIRPAKLRQIRYIVTGNVLQGMNLYGRGRLISFSLKDGSIGKGILMPEDWVMPEAKTVQVPVTKAYNIIQALEVYDFVESIHGDVMIKNMGGGRYEIRVPEATKRGAKYYTNEQLKSAIIDGYWEKRSDRMVAYFNDTELKSVLDILYDNFKTALVVEAKHVHKSTNQTESQDIVQNNTVSTRRRRVIDRKGLSAPEHEAIGARSERVGDRIPVEPIVGEKPKKIWEIQFDAAEKIGQKINYMLRPSERGKTIGAFTPEIWRVGIKWVEDLDTSAHELGHALDFIYGLVSGTEGERMRNALRPELMRLWKHGSKPPREHPNPETYLFREGIAEFIRALMVNPAEAKKFPLTHDWVHKRIAQVDADVWEGMMTFGRDLRVWWGSTEGQKIMSKIEDIFKENKIKHGYWNITNWNKFGQIQFTIFDFFSHKFFNQFDLVETLWKLAMKMKGIDPNDPRMLSPLHNFEYMIQNHLGLPVTLDTMMKRGFQNFNGETIYSRKFGEKLSLELLFRQLPSDSIKDFESNYELAISFGNAKRIVEVVWKQQAKLIGRVLTEYDDKLPPMHILKLHPYRESKHKDKIAGIIERIAKGELSKEDVELPEEMFDFSEMVVVGLADKNITDLKTAERWVAELDKMKSSDPAKYEWINNFLEVYYEFSEAWRDLLLDSGLITLGSHEQLGAENIYYMAMRRFMDVVTPENMLSNKPYESLETFKGERIKPPVHEIKGSHKFVKDPVKTFWEAWVTATYMASRNHTTACFARAFTGATIEVGKPKRTSDVAWVSATYEPGSIPFFVNGNQLFLVIRNDAVRKAFDELAFRKKKDLHPILSILFTPPRIARAAILSSLVFVLRNPPKDLGGLLTVGRDKRSLRPGDFISTKEQREAFKRSGAGMFGHFAMNEKSYNRFLKEIMLKTSVDPKKYIFLPWTFVRGKLSGLAEIVKSSEMIVRIPQFEATKRRMMEKYNLTEQEATIMGMFSSRDLMNYSVGGVWVKPFDPLMPFLNVAFREIHKILTSFRDRPKSTLLGYLMAVVIPSISLSLLYYYLADDETIEEYLGLPNFMRDMFYPIPIGGLWLMIPRGHGLGLTGAIIQRKMDQELLGDKNAFSEDWYRGFRGLITPVEVDGVVSGYQGFIAALANFDLFREKYIIPPEEQQMAIARRNYESASNFSRLMMELSDLYTKDVKHDYKIDPRKLDAFITGQFSWFGRMFLKATNALPLDRLVGQEWEKQDKFKFGLEDTGLFRRRGEAFANPDVQWVLRMFSRHREIFRNYEEYYLFYAQLTKLNEPEIQNDTDSRRMVARELIRTAKHIRETYENIPVHEMEHVLKQIRDAEREADRQ